MTKAFLVGSILTSCNLKNTDLSKIKRGSGLYKCKPDDIYIREIKNNLSEDKVVL